MKYYFPLLISFFSTIITQSQLTKANADKLVQMAVDSIQFAGATVLVAKGDEIIHHKGYGFAHVGFKVPAATDTRYFATGPHLMILAAITLQFTERKLISLDDRIRQHLPQLPAAYDSITIKHLLSSTSGIPDYHYLGDRYDRETAQAHHYDEVVDRFIDLPLNIKPGSGFDWSISNFSILTMILEKISGKPYSELLESIISRLKLSDTKFAEGESAIEKLAPGYYFGPENPGFFASSNNMLNYDPSARICTTTGDLFAIWNAIRNGTLIRKESFALMSSPEEAKRNNSGRFGYCLIMSNYDGKAMIHINGALGGYSSTLRYIPGEDITIIVLSNSGLVQEADQIGSSLARHFINMPPFTVKLPKQVVPVSLPIAADTMRMVSGTYQMKQQLKSGRKITAAMATYRKTIRVFEEHGQLLVQHSGGLPTRLIKQADGRYRITGSLPLASLRFVWENGHVKNVIKEYEGQSVQGFGTRIGDGDVKTFHSAAQN